MQAAFAETYKNPDQSCSAEIKQIQEELEDKDKKLALTEGGSIGLDEGLYRILKILSFALHCQIVLYILRKEDKLEGPRMIGECSVFKMKIHLLIIEHKDSMIIATLFGKKYAKEREDFKKSPEVNSAIKELRATLPNEEEAKMKERVIEYVHTMGETYSTFLKTITSGGKVEENEVDAAETKLKEQRETLERDLDGTKLNYLKEFLTSGPIPCTACLRNEARKNKPNAGEIDCVKNVCKLCKQCLIE